LPPGGEHPHLVLIGVSSEQALGHVLSRLQALGVICGTFREPDLGHELTAIATEPISGARRRFFRRYQCLRSAELLSSTTNESNLP
jgi:hypothetical protein